jgi:hypothetical protein
MPRSQQSPLRLVDAMEDSVSNPKLDFLLAQHAQVVKAARSQAMAAHGSVTSRKRHFAWTEAEATFAAAAAKVIG